MPLTSIVCPHCERSVEVQTTSVTRSRECPACGKKIILLLTSPDGKHGRRALLTVSGDGTDRGGRIASAGSGRSDPRPASGGARDSSINEPEVRRRLKQLTWGLVIFGGMVVFAVGNNFHWWSEPKPAQPQTGNLSRGSSVSDAFDESPPEPMPRIESKTEPPPLPDIPVNVLPPERKADALLTDLETAKNAAANFLAAKNVDERVGLVRDRALNEKRMRSYYALRGDGPVAYERIEARDVNSQGAFTFSFNVVLKNGTRREIIVGKAKSGKYVVDWASFVLYSEMGPGEFMAKLPRTGVMFRFMVSPADHFSGAFSDSEGLLCFRLVNPAEPDSPALFGYLSKSGQLGRVLKGITEKNRGQAQPLMLKVAYPENAAANNQVMITEFIGEGWIARNW